MAKLTASQDFFKGLHTSSTKLFDVVSKIVLKIMQRFRFPEPCMVVNLDPAKHMVQCEMLYRVQTGPGSKTGRRVTKWVKVYSPFASNDEGFCALPNQGDFGVIMFRAGDQAGEYFFGSWWGQINAVPLRHGLPLDSKDLIIKRNGSWASIIKKADIELWHRDENQTYLSSGFVITDTPEGQRIEAQKFCNQHTKSTEYKLCDWVRTTNAKFKEYQPFGLCDRLQLKRRRVTLSQTDIDGGITISDEMYENNVSDGTYTLYEETVDKSRIINDVLQNEIIFHIDIHQRRYPIGLGTNLLISPPNVESQELHMTYDGNWNKFTHQLTLRTTELSRDATTVKDELWYQDNYVYRIFAANQFAGEIKDQSTKDENSTRYKEAVAGIEYELNDFMYLNVTDDTIENQNTGVVVNTYEASHYSDDRWNSAPNGYNYQPGTGFYSV